MQNEESLEAVAHRLPNVPREVTAARAVDCAAVKGPLCLRLW